MKVLKYSNMSATVVKAKRQTTLPEDVCEAAGIKIRDQMDWRFEEGEIRGRKLVPVRKKVRLVRPVKFKDLLIAPQNLGIDMKQLDEEFRHKEAQKY
jgi:bifunctional DNA-binding transcriptional regulator/antitoxin component of YhaV-PrlF toxin-antitoxin module